MWCSAVVQQCSIVWEAKPNVMFLWLAGMYLFKCPRTDQVFELLRQRWSDMQTERERNVAIGHTLVPFSPAFAAPHTGLSICSLHVTPRPSQTAF